MQYRKNSSSLRSLFVVLGSLFIVVTTAIATVYLQNSKNIRSKAADGLACTAANMIGLNGCLNSGATKIEITEPIICDDKVICSISLRNKTGMEIYGTPGKAVGFVRRAKYDYNIFWLEDSKNIYLHDFTIDNVGHTCNRRDFTCGEDFHIDKSTNVRLERITDSYAQTVALTLRRSQYVSITDSKFVHSGLIAIWMGEGEEITRNYHIDNNVFAYSGTEAVLVQGIGTSTDWNSLSSNLFYHDHRYYTYDTCFGGKCSGTAVNVGENYYTNIRRNVITKGSIDNAPATDYVQSGGIEVSSPKSTNLNITENAIHNNTGAAVSLSYPLYASINPGNFVMNATIVVEGNKTYNNLLNLNPAGADCWKSDYQIIYSDVGSTCPLRDSNVAAITAKNCVGPGCFSLPIGKIFADPPFCLISQSGSSCSSKIHWFMNDGDVTKVMLSKSGQTPVLFSLSADTIQETKSGPNDAGWINEETFTFSLIDNDSAKDYASIRAVNTNPVVQVTPTATPFPTPIPNPSAIPTLAPTVTPTKMPIITPTPTKASFPTSVKTPTPTLRNRKPRVTLTPIPTGIYESNTDNNGLIIKPSPNEAERTGNDSNLLQTIIGGIEQIFSGYFTSQ